MASKADLEFRDRFEIGDVGPSDFNHRAHLRLAYVYLTELDVEAAYKRMREALLRFLKANGVPESKYHETLTLAWLQAVRHFMGKSAGATSFDGFLAEDERLSDTQIMLSHYRKETLFSDAARKEFISPDLEPIPDTPVPTTDP